MKQFFPWIYLHHTNVFKTRYNKTDFFIVQLIESDLIIISKNEDRIKHEQINNN